MSPWWMLDLPASRTSRDNSPAVRFQGSSNFQQPSIRGVSTSLVGSGVGSNVGIYVDGFYSSTATGSDFQLMNIQNIQVLKGPQGALFWMLWLFGGCMSDGVIVTFEISVMPEAAEGFSWMGSEIIEGTRTFAGFREIQYEYDRVIYKQRERTGAASLPASAAISKIS